MGNSIQFWHTNRCSGESVKRFWDRKCVNLRGTWTPNLRIHAKCANHLSCQGQTFDSLTETWIIWNHLECNIHSYLNLKNKTSYLLYWTKTQSTNLSKRFCNIHAMLKIRTISHANWLSLVNSCIYYTRQMHETYHGTALLNGFQNSVELWNPQNKTALSKCSFMWNKGPANIGLKWL